jgi:hypothetical protein
MDNGLVYCLSAVTAFYQLAVVDFISSWNYNDDSLTNDAWRKDIAWNAASISADYYGKRRREIDCSLDWDDYMTYELTIGDRITLDSNVTKGQSGNVNYWVQKINLDLEERILNLTLLEDTDN